ncbi:hypothetical protein LZC95_33065 [Pendulispora brunnea]|uniref:Lipoprotein n=1 Tax=Pendulispora brunnea TaxID=2905690 RepID=A0ABZ2JXR0_9BACT
MRQTFAMVSLSLMGLLGCSSTTESSSEPSSFPRAEDARASAKPSPAEPPNAALESDAEVDPIDAPSRAGLARATYLVWGRGRGSAPRTYAITTDGSVVADVPATVVAANGHLHRWAVRRVEVARRACRVKFDDADGVPAEQVKASQEAWQAEQEDIARNPTRTVDQAELVDLSSGTRKVVSQLRLDDAAEGDLVAGANDFSFEVTLTGSVDSYLFVRESTWVDSCGAHGHAFSAAGVLDIANDAKPMDLGSVPVAALRKARARAEKQFDELRKEWNGEAEDDTELVELLPQYDARGTLSFAGRFATFAPYAFSRGDWASYTLATTTPLRAFPNRLPRPAAPPSAIRVFLQSKPDFTMGGFSKVERT